MVKKKAGSIPIKNVKITGGFWDPIQKMIINEVIPYQEKILNDELPLAEKSHAFSNFRIAAGLEEGEFYGMVFQDSDVAKWLEGVAYSLDVSPNEILEAKADAIIETIAEAQQPDGYLNTYFTIKEPEHRWQNLQECHELYCAGHMMEAAVAYYEATGKDTLLQVMEAMSIHIAGRFGPDKEPGIPGHQEVEIGLMRMYHATGNDSYRKLAAFFIDQRGKDPDYFAREKENRDWYYFGPEAVNPVFSQCHKPLREQTEAVGHSVRAVYMYTAMADMAAATGDDELYEACIRLWDNMIQKRMYITGGIGSTPDGEGFTLDYDLPNDSAYAETCASIGLVFFAKQMLDITLSGQYADVMELALYNNILSGIQLDGKRFFYANPQEVEPGVSGELFGYRHALPQRQKWYSCACCPPNLVRMIASLSGYAFSENESTIYSHLFLDCMASLDKADIRVNTQYPWTGKVTYLVRPKQKDSFGIAIRIPSWAEKYCLTLNSDILNRVAIENGYAYIHRKWEDGDLIELNFEMSPRQVYANPLIRADAGKVALMRGPLVYCFEGVDHDAPLQTLQIPSILKIEEKTPSDGVLKDMVILHLSGKRDVPQTVLYTTDPATMEATIMTAIPYFAWGNRGITQMRIWMQREI